MEKPTTNREGYERVLAVLKERGDGKADLARFLGVTRQAVNAWPDEVPERCVLQVAVYSGIPAEDILPETVEQAKGYMEYLRKAG